MITHLAAAATPTAAASTEPPAALPVGEPARRRVCVLSEDLSGAPDEGIKKFALAVACALAPQHEVRLLSTRGLGAPLPAPGSRLRGGCTPAPRTFLSTRLSAELRRFRPEVLLYAARSSTTFMSFVRSRVLKAYCPQATVVLLGLQARRHQYLMKKLVPILAPDLVCVQSPASQQYLERLGCTVELVPSGVDVETFRPVTPERRRELRARYGLRADVPVVLHVGHLKSGRGVQVLAELAAQGACQVVLVASSSTAQEAELGQELRRAGVVVLTEYLPHIEQLYQLADCYVFPVESTDNAIEVPLSVLEAFACDLPVVTTRFGGLPRLFGEREGAGLVFVDSPAALVAEAVRVCWSRSRPHGTRSLALPYSWAAIGAGLLERVLLARRRALGAGGAVPPAPNAQRPTPNYQEVKRA